MSDTNRFLPYTRWPDELAQHYRAKGYWRGETFSQLLRSRAEAQGGAVAVVGMDQRWTYGELLQKAETAAAGFLALGLKPGDRVEW